MLTMQGGRSLEGSQSLNGLVLAMLTGDPFVSRLYLMLIDCSRWQWDLLWFSCWTLSKAAAFKETSSSRVDGCYGLTVQRVNIVTSKLAVQKSSLQVPSLDHSERWHTHTHTHTQWPQWMFWGSLVAVGWFVVSSMLQWHAEWKKNLQDPAESHVSVDMMVGRMFVEWSVLKYAMSHSEVVLYHCIPC